MSAPSERDRDAALWRCEGCGEQFTEPTYSHAVHANGCDEYNCHTNCPEECGPVTFDREAFDAAIATGRAEGRTAGFAEGFAEGIERAAHEAATIRIAMSGEQVQERRELVAAIRALEYREGDSNG